MAIFAVAGTGTDVGKTVASAVLLHALKADYWKPVQTGLETDSETISRLKPESSRIFPEAYHFAEPASPHYAAGLEGASVQPGKITLPDSGNLVVELAGGIMVPLNSEGFLNIDLLEQLSLPVFLVTRNYLGSINHTLLTISELKRRNITIAGLIVSGQPNNATEGIYKTLHPELVHFAIPELEKLTVETIQQVAESWKK